MTAQWRLGAMDRMRLIDRPEAFYYYAIIHQSRKGFDG